jgi:hypothetical protein
MKHYDHGHVVLGGLRSRLVALVLAVLLAVRTEGVVMVLKVVGEGEGESAVAAAARATHQPVMASVVVSVSQKGPIRPYRPQNPRRHQSRVLRMPPVARATEIIIK